MKRKISLFLSVLIIMLSFKVCVYAQVSNPVRGMVVEILDGEALVMKFNNTNVKVRLIGVKTNASQEAYNYMISNVKGKYAYIRTDDFYNSQRADSAFVLSYIYMYDTGEMINQKLLNNGLAELDTSHKEAQYYKILENAQEYASSNKNGLWSDSSLSSTNYVNINTATSTEIKNINSAITSALATEIINYREYNSFNTVSEIKFVKGMTKEIYDLIKNSVTVCTNINTASEKELLTLKGLTDSDVEKILDYRNSKGSFSYLGQLQTKANITSNKYKDNLSYISLEEKKSINEYIGKSVVNINTATVSQIVTASDGMISSDEAEIIVKAREKGYSYKTLGELMELGGVELTETQINRLEDNLHLYTDINNAETSELRSLFGSKSNVANIINKIEQQRPFKTISEFKQIVDLDKYDIKREYIYIDEYSSPDRININLASDEQLGELDLTAAELNSLKKSKGSIKDFNDIKFDVENIDSYISLYTDINLADKRELMTLENMTASLAEDIIEYRTNQPFGSKDEIKKFFTDKNQLALYNQIRDYIVVR